MPRKSLHGRTCGVSRDGGRARALQPSGRSAALLLLLPTQPRSHCLKNRREQLAKDGDIFGRIIDQTHHTSTHHTSAIVVQLAAGQKQPCARDLQDIHIVLGAG
ncbi:hypothetical protein XhhCFBP4925_08640 [Xanthomonas hortorum pv. hederae]|nr:hypothetical protein XhhCFBP4925_08640 [Xanthomonas hortorum pv. hederae]